jgi:hypothetical protein
VFLREWLDLTLRFAYVSFLRSRTAFFPFLPLSLVLQLFALPLFSSLSSLLDPLSLLLAQAIGWRRARHAGVLSTIASIYLVAFLYLLAASRIGCVSCTS